MQTFSKLLNFSRGDHFEYRQPYVNFQIEHFVPSLHSKWSELKHSSTNWGHFFFKTISLSTNTSMLSSKLNVLSHNSLPIIQIWKIPSQTGVVFSRQSFWAITTLCYLQNWTFCLVTLSQVVRFEKFFHEQGLFFFTKMNIFCTNSPILSSKLNILTHISALLNIIWSMFT